MILDLIGQSLQRETRLKWDTTNKIAQMSVSGIEITKQKYPFIYCVRPYTYF